MSIDAGLRTLLLAEPAISALVGARMHSDTLPQASPMPAITYFEVSGERPHASPQGPLGLCGSRFQIDAWASNKPAALSLANQIRLKLAGYKGTAGDVTIQGAFIAGSRHFYESETKQYRVSRDYIVWFEEAID